MILQGESYESWYCLPDSCFFHVCNAETSSRVTLATLGTVFQTDFIACWMLLVGYRLLDIACWISLVGYRLLARCFLARCFLAIMAINQTTKSQNNKTTRQQKKTRIATFIFDGAFIAQE